MCGIRLECLAIEKREVNMKDFYCKYQLWCDKYVEKMKELDMHTTCYDLVAAIKICDII